MTIKDFFRLLIKVFALCGLATTIFTALPRLINQNMLGLYWKNLFFIGAIVIALVALFLWLLFNPDKLIELLKLEQGFDSSQISFGALDDRLLIKVVCISIGIVLVVGSVSSLLSQMYYVFKGDSYYFSSAFGTIINMIMGYLLIRYYELITNFLLSKKSQ